MKNHALGYPVSWQFILLWYTKELYLFKYTIESNYILKNKWIRLDKNLFLLAIIKRIYFTHIHKQ